MKDKDFSEEPLFIKRKNSNDIEEKTKEFLEKGGSISLEETKNQKQMLQECKKIFKKNGRDYYTRAISENYRSNCKNDD